jgi:predicted ArsR family transcriptional regulator
VQFTRERILSILKEHGQATVDELSQELGLTTVTIRHHLDILRGEGLITAPLIRRRKTPGRPQYVYALAEKAGSLFPKRYEHLARLIINEMHSHLSPEKVDQLMQRIGEHVASQATLPDGDDFEARLVAAVEFLNELGYMARWEPSSDGNYLLHITNCPYEQVSQHNREVCTMDMALLNHLLGVSPERTSWTAQGDLRCAYVVRPADK